MRVLALLLAVACACAASAAEVYQVMHVRPSRILAAVTGGKQGDRLTLYVASDVPGKTDANGLIPAGITSMKADDGASTISIEGSDQASEDMKRILALFDVAPRQIGVRIAIVSPADKSSSTTKTQILNNTPWTLQDGLTGLKITISPRINNDGGMTGQVEIAEGKKTTSVVARIKNGEFLHFKVADNGTVTVPSKGDKSKSKTPEIDITINFEIIEAPNSGPIQP
ncbi:MAG TPA: hypothetical protein VHE55_15790 [Fimbriimonadaceae bacterium]|nr:hypothetical protein [Fimbriimonadaceae bacterium]